MTLKYHVERIKNDKLKKTIIFIIFIIPSLEILQHLYSVIKYGATPLQPDYASFLAANSTGRILQPLLLWFLPLYLLVISGDDCIEDYNTGYKNILVSKWGKKKYFTSNMGKAFVVCFLTVFIGLIIDLLLVHIIFYNGTHNPGDSISFPENYLYTISIAHPAITNICYCILTACLGGVIGAAGTAMAIALHDRKLVYPLTFAIWLIPLLFHNSLMIVIQPFTEYDFPDLLPTCIFFIAFCILASFLSYLWEVKIAKI